MRARVYVGERERERERQRRVKLSVVFEAWERESLPTLLVVPY